MLSFILGASKSGKSKMIEERIKKLCVEGKKVLLIVPEQASFETEKNLFESLSNKFFANVNVISFTRLAHEIFKTYGQISGNYITDSGKSILMDLAIEQIKDEFEIYKNSADKISFNQMLVDTVTEFKNAGVYPQKLNKEIDVLESGALKTKLTEINKVYSIYQAMLENTYKDPLDDIQRAVKLLYSKDYFKDLTVFVDEFKGFTQNELDLLEQILISAEDVVVSLCIDRKRVQKSDISIFSSVQNTYIQLLTLARKLSVKVKPPVYLESSYYNSKALSHLEKNVFSFDLHYFEERQNDVLGIRCKNEYDEIDILAAYVNNLIKEHGYKYNDIAVVARKIDDYLPIIENVFTKNGIPFHSDKKENVLSKPLIRFIISVLNCAIKGMTPENVLNVLKCDFTEFNAEEIAEFENYIYVWGVKSSNFAVDFTANPRGYKEEFSENDKAELERVNKIRDFIYSNVTEFRNVSKDVSGKEICFNLLSLLKKIKAKEKTESKIEYYLKNNEFYYANDYAKTYDVIIDILELIAVVIKDKKITLTHFLRVFTLSCMSFNIGNLPQSIDMIMIGSAEKIRVSDKKVVFIIGTNLNVFPLVPETAGIFSDYEKQKLCDIGINISKPSFDKIKEERFIAYKTMTLPSQKLYVMAPKADIMGKEIALSPVFSMLEIMFGNDAVIDSDDIDDRYFCFSKSAAFSYLVNNLDKDSTLVATLYDYFLSDDEYKDRLIKFKHIKGTKDYKIKDLNNAQKLFGKNLNISPTRAESFYKCRFRYFCEHGLRVFPLRKADLDPLETGNLIHGILYSVTKQTDLKNTFDEVKIKQIISECMDIYLNTVMGGIDTKSKRFLYFYQNIAKLLFSIIEKLHFELLQSEFIPTDFEYEISKVSEVTPLKLATEDNCIINVHGKIDRIDIYTAKDGKKYVRIVDYKSGKKLFDLNDILYGINLQMLLYLHCIEQNGKGKYENIIPAGILYMPSGEKIPSLGRNADESTIKQEKIKNYRMNGLLIDDKDVLKAMENPVKGIFIPIKENNDGSIAKSSFNSLVTLQELSSISRYVDSLIINMANELHKGNVQAAPLKGACDYCDYKSVCRIDDSMIIDDLEMFKTNQEIVERMCRGGILDE